MFKYIIRRTLVSHLNMVFEVIKRLNRLKQKNNDLLCKIRPNGIHSML